MIKLSKSTLITVKCIILKCTVFFPRENVCE